MSEKTEDIIRKKLKDFSRPAPEGLWERKAEPITDPSEELVTRARSTIVALAGLDEEAIAA